ncbi:MAG: rhodanese-like domain-containing protein [Verrucomicrobiota bacterium]
MRIVLASAVLGALNWTINPNRPPFSPETLQEGEIDLVGLGALGDPIYLDARSLSEFEEAHIPGAMLLNEDDWDQRVLAFIDRWEPGQTIVVYCSSLACQASHAVAERLKAEMGIDEVFVLKGGWEVWQEANDS